MNSTDYSRDIEAFERRIKELKSKADSALGELKSEVRSIRDRDPAARSDAEVLLLYPGLHAVIAHRIAHKLYKNGKLFADYKVEINAICFPSLESALSEPPVTDNSAIPSDDLSAIATVEDVIKYLKGLGIEE